jgi:hypothetical protein
MNKILIILILLFSLSGCGLSLATANLMSPCWVGGRAVFNCEGNTLVHWSRNVSIKYYLDVPEEHRRDILFGINTWNREIRENLFVETKNLSQANLYITNGPSTGGLGATSIYGTTNIEYAIINISSFGCPTQTARIITHELGHVLGLDHSQWGIMAGVPEDICGINFSNGISSSKPINFWLLLPSDAEVDLVKSLYL